MNMATLLSKGYDVNTVLDAIKTELYKVKYDAVGEALPVSVFPTGTILTGEGNKPSLYQGVLGFLTIGDLKRVEASLRNKSRWGVHDAIFMVIVSGENDTAKKKVNDIARLVEISIDEHPTMGKTGLMVTLADDNPILRRPVTFDKESKSPQWNSAVIIKMVVRIARMKS
jgi:hypothetical protein